MSESTGKKIVQQAQLKLGLPTPWALFDGLGNLLLSEGTPIENEKQIESLIHRGAYYYLGPDLTTYKPSGQLDSPVSTYSVVTNLLERLERRFTKLEQFQEQEDQAFVRQIVKLVIDIQSTCAENPDAVLGTLQLILDAPGSVAHPLQCALICEIAADRLGWGVLDRIPLIAAALTQNIGMLGIQSALETQTTPLSREQREIINAHPKRSALMLKKLGVNDRRWLRSVLQHHERLDGSGYPSGLAGEEVTMEAQLLAIADSYVAMTRPRAYRPSLRSTHAMSQLFKEGGHAVDKGLSKLFLRVMGLFAPGSLLRLTTGEVGIVFANGQKSDTPVVSVITDRRSQSLDAPQPPVEVNANDISGVLNLNDYAKLVAHLGAIWPDLKALD